MVTFTLVYRGGLRCEAAHGPSGTTLITDAPRDNQGQGASFSPTDLVATALATCICTTMAIQTRADGIVLDGIRAEIEKHMTSTPPRRIARLVVKLEMPVGIPLLARIKLERIANACPVALSLHPEVVQEIGFSYPD